MWNPKHYLALKRVIRHLRKQVVVDGDHAFGIDQQLSASLGQNHLQPSPLVQSDPQADLQAALITSTRLTDFIHYERRLGHPASVNHC